MTRPRLYLLLIGVAFILLFLGLCTGVWWYFFGANKVDAAELVPADTVAFATIPNAATIVAGYETSQLKTLVDSPNAKPLHDAFVNFIGQKNADLFNAFLPNLSGQSFIAVTHFDYDHPEKVGLIAGMKPKAGLGDFDAFLEKLKATWPDILKQGRTGTGSVAGVDYEWIQGPGASDKICVARLHGWIVTTWGEASLQDWVERFRKQSSTSSLAQDPDYQKARAAVGDNPMTLVYVNNHALIQILQEQMAKTNPAAGDYLAKKFATSGGAALATRFEDGEIVDRFSFLMPRPAQVDSGMGVDPCPFDTLKFAGPDTSFYWASSINWKQCYQNFKDQPGQTTSAVPIANDLLTFLQTWTQGSGVDPQHNIIDALGSEISVQAEWSQDATYPEAGLFVKLDNPDDFKPTITAIIESVRKAYANTAVIKELNSGGQNFASLEFVQASPLSPTITEDGPYLGVFLTENQAVRSFQRDQSIGLTHNAGFTRQTGDKLKNASQLFFLDAPRLLNRGYQTAMPYLSLAGMFNKDLAAMLNGRDLPADLTWLAPMGTWSCVITPDGDGIQGYSVSGIGNQGILLGGGLWEGANIMQSMGFFPKPATTPATAVNPAPPVAPIPNTPAGNGTNATNPVLPPVETSNAMTNASSPTHSAAGSVTNSAPTNSAPLLNSNADANPSTPAPANPQ
jgi:hypothetical protein